MVADSAPRLRHENDLHVDRDFAGLLRQAKAGQASALGALLQWYINYLTILASTQLDRRLRRRVAPSDIVQETLLAAHRDFGGFRGESQGELLAWLRQILIHSLHRHMDRHIKAEKRDVRRDVSIHEAGNRLDGSACHLAGRLTDRGDSPSAAMQRKEGTEAFADALNDVPDRYREVITMRVLQGLSFDEIAKQTNKSSGAVRMLWLRALRSLKIKEESVDAKQTG